MSKRQKPAQQETKKRKVGTGTTGCSAKKQKVAAKEKSATKEMKKRGNIKPARDSTARAAETEEREDQCRLEGPVPNFVQKESAGSARIIGI